MISDICFVTSSSMNDLRLNYQYLDVDRDHAAVHLLSVYGGHQRQNAAAGVNVEVTPILVWRH